MANPPAQLPIIANDDVLDQLSHTELAAVFLAQRQQPPQTKEDRLGRLRVLRQQRADADAVANADGGGGDADILHVYPAGSALANTVARFHGLTDLG